MSIKINVGGSIFETTECILRKITYFNDLFNDTSLTTHDILFVNRPAHMFKHVLVLAIDDTYKYPKKYSSELAFYGVTCDDKSFYDPISIYDIAFAKFSKDQERYMGNHEWSIKDKFNSLTIEINNLSTKLNSENNDYCLWENCGEKMHIDGYCRDHTFKCDFIIEYDRKYGNRYYCEKSCNKMLGSHFRCPSHIGVDDIYKF